MRSSWTGSLMPVFFCLTGTRPTAIYTLSLHDALPIFLEWLVRERPPQPQPRVSSVGFQGVAFRSEEHTSELQSHSDLVCRLLLEKKKRVGNRRLSVDVTQAVCRVELSSAQFVRAQPVV